MKKPSPPITPRDVRQMTEELCRIAGYGLTSGIHPGPKAAEASNYLLFQLRKYGLEARLEAVTIRDPWPESWSLTVRDNGKPQDVLAIPCGWTVGTPNEGIESEMVYIHEGTARWFQEVNVNGKIVLVDYDTVTEFKGITGEGHTNSIANAVTHGAVGMILAEKKNPSPRFYPSPMSGIGDPNVIAGLPVFDCGRAEGDYLRGLCRSEIPVRVNMKLDVRHAYKNCDNVVGILHGNGSIDEILMPCCHYDGCFTSALDNNAGVAFVLGLAKYFAAKPRESRNRDMWFIFFFGHDVGGNQGHQQFVATHQDIMSKLILFDIDHPVPGLRYDLIDGAMVRTDEDNMRLFSGTSLTLAEMARWVNFKYGLRSAILRGLPGGNPNSRDFIAAGVPVATTGCSFAWYYHTTEDTMDHLPLEQFERSFPADCEMLELMANTPEGYLIFNNVNQKQVVPGAPPKISIQVLSNTALLGDPVVAWIGQDTNAGRPLSAVSIFPKHASIIWDWGDDTGLEEGLSGVHFYQKPGQYTLTVTVTDDYEAQTSACHNFLILAKPV